MFRHVFHLFNEQDWICSLLEATRNDFDLTETNAREFPRGWFAKNNGCPFTTQMTCAEFLGRSNPL